MLHTALDVLGSDIDRVDPVIATYARVVLRSSAAGVWRQRMPDNAASTAQLLFAVVARGGCKNTLRTVSGVHFLWLVLPHVLPKGLRRSRNFGLLHPNCKHRQRQTM